LGWHLGQFDFIINPILDNSWTGFTNLDFAPSARLAYNVSKTWAVAAEVYSDYGPLKHMLSTDQQSQQLFGVVDYKGDDINIEAGVGFGLTPASDRWVVKLMISAISTNPRRTPRRIIRLRLREIDFLATPVETQDSVRSLSASGTPRHFAAMRSLVATGT
jgi:hypothetical protein